MLQRLRRAQRVEVLRVLPKADRALAVAWWIVLVLRGVLPAVFAVAMGVLVGAVQRGDSLAGPLAFGRRLRAAAGAGADPDRDQRQPRRSHRGLALRPADRGLRAPARAWATSRIPTLTERPHRGARLRPRHDRPAAVDLDGLHRRRPGRDDRRPRVGRRARRPTRGGRRSCSAAPGWRRTGCCARARVWRDRNTDEVRARAARRRLRLPAGGRSAGQPRSCGCSASPAGRSTASSTRRTRLHELQYEATRLRERPVLWSLLLVVARQRRRVLVAGRAPPRAARSTSAELVVFAQSAVGTSMIAFGGLNWALDGAAAPVAAVLRLEPAMAPAGALRVGHASGRRAARARDPLPRRDASRIPGGAPVLDGFDLTIPAGSSLAIVGQNGAGKTTLAKLLCRLLRPAVRRDRDRRRRPARARPRVVARARRPPCSRTSSASSCRCATTSRRPARRTTWCARRSTTAGAADLAGARHGARARLRRRHRSVGRPVAARRAGARAVRRAARRRRRAARRADRAARRARRGGDLRAHPRRDAALHDDPDLAPLLDRAPRRSHLRARARPRRRARHARRADGARRPLPHDVRPAGAALQRRRTDEEGTTYDVLA